MSAISLTYEGIEILQDVIIADARFESAADGQPGPCSFRVKDDEHTYLPGYFHAGGVLELTIDGTLSWAGVIITVRREYAFNVDNTSVPGNTPRFWVIEGTDWNILFSRRVVFNVADPTTEIPTYTGLENDGDVVIDIVTNYIDLSDDGISTAGVETIGPLSPYGEPFNAANVSDTWGAVMSRIAQANNAVYYLSPEKVLQFHDKDTPNAPFSLSDAPLTDTGSVGYREVAISSSATEMANDALVWGAGLGDDEVVFARVEDPETIDLHGRLQFGDFRHDMWKQLSVQRRAETYVYGSPFSRRGHREPTLNIGLTIFEPGLRPGMVVEFISHVWDESTLVDNPPLEDPPPSFPTVPANLSNFAQRIRKIESGSLAGNYTAQNKSSGAYGAYQIMPGNWRYWGPDILGTPFSTAFATKYTNGATWSPSTSPPNQDTVALTKFNRMFQWLGDWRRVAAAWRSGGSVAVRQPSEWSRGTILYVNHACMPLGFPAVTSATVLPPLGTTTDSVETNADIQSGIGFVQNRVADEGGIPVRRCVISFPTPTDARFQYLLAHKPDVAFLNADPQPPIEDDEPPDKPLDEDWITEVFPPIEAGPGFTGTLPTGSGISDLFYSNRRWNLRHGSVGDTIAGGIPFASVYSTVGIAEGWLSNLAWNTVSCGGIGPGAYTNWETQESWFEYGTASTVAAAGETGYDGSITISDYGNLGFCPGFDIRIARLTRDPIVSDYGSGTVIAHVDNPRGFTTGAPDFGYEELFLFGPRRISPGAIVRIPRLHLTGSERLFIIFAPSWECTPTNFTCGPAFNAGIGGVGTVCDFLGPRCSGEFGSGQLDATPGAFIGSLLPAGSDASTGTAIVDVNTGEVVTQYRTNFPYLAGTLEITFQGMRLIRGVDFEETNPANGLFTLTTTAYDASDYLYVTYQRTSSTPTQAPPGSDPNEPRPEPGASVDAVEAVIREAFSYLGTPYRLGAESRTAIDCSGLIFRIFTDTGYGSLIGNERKTAAGYTRYFANQGNFTRDLSRAQRGDLISYWNGSRVTHIGIYIGNGYVISALDYPGGVTKHRTLGISVPFYGVCMVPYPETVPDTGGDTAVGSDTDPEDPQAPTEPLPTSQTVYRPALQQHLGWGTQYDGANAIFACSAMALDRHTLGARSATRSPDGRPLSTPPTHRTASGSTSFAPTMFEAQRAWMVGWGESMGTATVTWDSFVASIQLGRGAVVHAGTGKWLYINEQQNDGSFWGYDPDLSYGVSFPYTNLRSRIEVAGRVEVGYTRITPI